jgi:hypothetical protein
MNEAERAIVRACLDQVELGMTEAREVRAWFSFLSEDHRTEWKDFGALVAACRKSLSV